MEAMERVKQSANLITSHVCDNISKAYFELVLADFARQCCWHGPENLAVPYDLQLVFDSAHSLELQQDLHEKTLGDTVRFMDGFDAHGVGFIVVGGQFEHGDAGVFGLGGEGESPHESPVRSEE